ncbi:FHA domain-containing protein [Geodermatophilus saharensis]|uniref:FHA domain-containing protein n=1 Tax=Geodermatophilus saharensis TaxID=1137994 RepID=A0A239AC32_9ACTN|nr:FHA domain-containing protein [Geodermatophilus saharensis]SNR92604.1 FHA domain-containing protein [Geodermatophilus saharensis]
MPDRCEVLPGDAVVARRGGGLLWVDAPGSPALVAALHACLGVAGPGADRVLAAVASQVPALGGSSASFALVLVDSEGGSGTGVALWAGKGQPAVDGVPVSGQPADGCTVAAGFPLGGTLYVGPGQAAPSMPPGVAYDLHTGTVPGSGALLHLAAPAHAGAAAAPASAAPSSFTAGSDAGFAGSSSYGAASGTPSYGSSGSSVVGSAARADEGEETAFWKPDTASAPVLRFDDGLVVTVDEDLVLGRRPDSHELVTSGNARPVPIADTQNVLSSAHAAIQRTGREVTLTDLGSLNGTHVAGPEATEWTQLEPGVAHPLADGDRLLLGWTVITYEQPQD